MNKGTLMNYGIEKRRHARISLTYVTVDAISVTGEIKKTETSSVIDISESGMKFSTPTAYPVNFLLRLTFILPDTALPIRTEASVIHQQKFLETYHTGVKFKGMTLAEYTILKTYIERNLTVN